VSICPCHTLFKGKKVTYKLIMWFTVSIQYRQSSTASIIMSDHVVTILPVFTPFCTGNVYAYAKTSKLYLHNENSFSRNKNEKNNDNNNKKYNGHTIREKSFGNRPCRRCDWPAATTRARVTGPDVSTRLRLLFTYFLWNDLVLYFEVVVFIEYCRL